MKLNRSDRISLLLRPVPGLLCAMFFGFGLWVAIGARNVGGIICMVLMTATSILVSVIMYSDYRTRMAQLSLINHLRSRAITAEMRLLEQESRDQALLHWPGMNTKDN